LVIFGPTASGKTAILHKLFCTSKNGKPPICGVKAEIVSADSMQVYRGMDIGTAKPDANERAELVHHLIDIRDPRQQFNVGDFVHLAEQTCLEISSSGKLPVVSGGTGFYLKNFILGLSEAPPSASQIREQLKKELLDKGAVSLMEELTACDPVSAGRIHINDEYRMLRALEVYRSCGKPLSSFQMNRARVNDRDRKFNFIKIGLSRPREELYDRINLRCAKMFRSGLQVEVQSLFDAGYTPNDPGLRAIGYREFFIEVPEADNPCKSAGWKLSQDINGVQALVAQNSRRYAKRQITFFAGIPDVTWIEAFDNDDETAGKIMFEVNKNGR